MQGTSVFSIRQDPVFPLWGRKYVSTSVPFCDPNEAVIGDKPAHLLAQSYVSNYSLAQAENDVIQEILELFSFVQGNVFLEKIKLRVNALLDIDELKEENIVPLKQSFFALFVFLISNRDFCERWLPSIFISSDGYATLQYINTDKNQFFNIKFLGFGTISYVIINKNDTLFRLENHGSKESFFKYLEESRICL